MPDPNPPTADTELIDLIGEALRAATPGPWYLDDAGDVRGHSTIEAERMVARPLMSAYRKDANAHLIANAPTWLAQLLAKLEAEHREVERLREALERAARELGIPTDDYPAPVANAWEIIMHALADAAPDYGGPRVSENENSAAVPEHVDPAEVVVADMMRDGGRLWPSEIVKAVREADANHGIVLGEGPDGEIFSVSVDGDLFVPAPPAPEAGER